MPDPPTPQTAPIAPPLEGPYGERLGRIRAIQERERSRGAIVDQAEVQADDGEALRLIVHHLGAEVTEDWHRTAEGWVDQITGMNRPYV